MSIQIDCPGCGEPCAVPPHLYGTDVKCPRCAVQFVAPQPAPTSLLPAPETAAMAYQPAPVVCPFCGTNSPLIKRKKVLPIGWVGFGLLIILCAPLCWLPLYIREEVLTCSGCKRRLA